MKTTITALATTLTTATTALAAAGTPGEGIGLLAWLFLGLVASILVLQCVPAAVFLVSMLRSVFAGTATQDVSELR